MGAGGKSADGHGDEREKKGERAHRAHGRVAESIRWVRQCFISSDTVHEYVGMTCLSRTP